jgi:hypothetical protein
VIALAQSWPASTPRAPAQAPDAVNRRRANRTSVVLVCVTVQKERFNSAQRLFGGLRALMNLDWLYGLIHVGFWSYVWISLAMVQTTMMAVTV